METFGIVYNGYPLDCECDVTPEQIETREDPYIRGQISILKISIEGVDITDLLDLEDVTDQLELNAGMVTENGLHEKNKWHAIYNAKAVLKMYNVS